MGIGARARRFFELRRWGTLRDLPIRLNLVRALCLGLVHGYIEEVFVVD
jgi:hypothetical protein